MALAVVIFEAAGIITGQTAGLALLLSKTFGLPFGVVFVLVNLPFFVLAALRMGREFTVKTAIAILAVSCLTYFGPQWIVIEPQNTLVAAVLAGIISAVGLVVLFRHRASLGGVGILALYLQERFGFPAGYTQMIFDAVLFAAALFVLDPLSVGVSVIAAVTTNLMIALNHRTDRYIAR